MSPTVIPTGPELLHLLLGETEALGVFVELAGLLDAGLEHLERAERQRCRSGGGQQVWVGERGGGRACCKANQRPRHAADTHTRLHADLTDLRALLHEHGQWLLAGEQADDHVIQLEDEVLHVVAGKPG